eukprot:1057324-Pyramimonas_sp.AAC.1
MSCEKLTGSGHETITSAQTFGGLGGSSWIGVGPPFLAPRARQGRRQRRFQGGSVVPRNPRLRLLLLLKDTPDF